MTAIYDIRYKHYKTNDSIKGKNKKHRTNFLQLKRACTNSMSTKRSKKTTEREGRNRAGGEHPR